MSRKYSDNKYDKPEYDARIEQQTLKALESLGINQALNNEDTMQSPAFKREINNLKKPENERRSDHSGPRQPKEQPGTLSGTATQKHQSELLASLGEPQSAHH